MKVRFLDCCIYKIYCYRCDIYAIMVRDKLADFLAVYGFLDSVKTFLENRGTRSNYCHNVNTINSFPVPLGVWDKRGTKVGQDISAGRVFFAKHQGIQ